MDIQQMLNLIMEEYNCSCLYAFYLLMYEPEEVRRLFDV